MNIQEINIIGAGSLGSFTAQILTKMNPNWQCPINVWDFDKVEEHNIENQLYSINDAGELKTAALSRIINNLGGPNIHMIDSAVDEKTDLRNLVIVAVDSMAVRKKILNVCKFNWGVDYLIEARMGGHIGKIFALDPKNPEAIERYGQYFFEDQDVENPTCATNETIPTLWMVAASIAKLVLLYHQAIVLSATFTEGTVNLTDWPIVNFDTYALI